MDKAPAKPLTYKDKKEFITLLRDFDNKFSSLFSNPERVSLYESMKKGMSPDVNAYSSKGMPKAIMALKTASLFAEQVDADHNILIAILMAPLLEENITDILSIRRQWGEDVAGLLTGLFDAGRFAEKNNMVNHENFRGLLLSLADDIRVIIIMIVKNLVLMREINNHPDEQWVRNVAFEANFLYAQLAHRLGLYKLKSELEDLSLKYTNREIYSQIAVKLNETKRSREAYIKSFINPLKEKLKNAGLKFEIKGRTKSISSIWNKMKKQKVDVNGIYDLFAIRVILDSELEKEKSDCWLAYSILADMYTANPARMRDWITIPKSNGYESLHATVLGPESKWVEVQFRTKRMDLVAEKGLAAHWRYKGVSSDSSDQWMNNIRDILESAENGPMQLMKDLKTEGYEKEVFAFTPKGDLFKLPSGATVLDFAFQIHSNVGSHCTGAVVNGQNKKLTYKICNGDTVEILTSANQTPKAAWLNMVVTGKARNKIRQSLNEDLLRRANLGKELIERRAKNRKIDIDEAAMMRIIKKNGYKHANDFFADVADNKIDPIKFLHSLSEEISQKNDFSKVSAEEFQMSKQADDDSVGEVLKIGDKNISGINFKFAGCCSPVYGDKIFGFISSDGTVKVHRIDCPNAFNIRSRYPYRIIKAEWSGKSGDMMQATLKIIGYDDIGIVSTITSIISKETGTMLRNISVDSNDGMFQGILGIGISQPDKLNSLIKKLNTVKGLKSIERI